MNICHFCENKNFRDNKVQYTYKRDNKYIIVNDVPCQQCEFCGEQYFKASVLENIEMEFDAIRSKGKSVKKKVVIPVEAYKDINNMSVASS
jgi:YgiT-type zinc finger domain-containing protein